LLRLAIPEPRSILFETALEPVAPVVDKLRKEIGFDEGEINILRGKKNQVAVGEPYFENLISRYKDQNQELPREIKNMATNYDFHYVRLSCTFLPDKDCRFDWARFGVELSAESGSGEPSSINPIAYDVFPSEVLSEIKCKREIDFTSELKLLAGIVNVGTEISQSKEFIIYEPQINGFGINRSSTGWNFDKTKEKGIWGDRIVLLVVRAPKNSKVRARFLLGAEVSSHLSKWIPIPVTKKRTKLLMLNLILQNKHNGISRLNNNITLSLMWDTMNGECRLGK
jgi:hypothetical protein